MIVDCSLKSIDKVFDILYVKGKRGETADLLNQNVKLSDRKKLLQKIIPV
jgi:hypothetical protein